MTMAQDLARFAAKASFLDLSKETQRALKIRVLDSIGCALGALGAEPIRMLRAQVDDFGESGRSTLIGGGKAAPDRAALYNSALVRYLDFNDSYLAKGETCHPSDNLGAVLAATEYAGAKGKDFLVALAVSYQVQCRLSDLAPVRHRGFDHTVQGAYAVASGVSRALGLDTEKTANAIAISGTALNALRVTRTGSLSHWKGLAFPFTAFCATSAAFLAMRGISGPVEVFEGNKGFMDAIAGDFHVDWAAEPLDAVNRTVLKKYNAEVHSQSAIEAVLELRESRGFSPGEIEKIQVETFDVAYHIIGGGEEGDKTRVRTKEQADHSLPYMIAAALLDGGLMPEQYRPDRILREDVQDLLSRVAIRPREDYTRRFPDEMPTRVAVFLKDGRLLEKEKRDYEGFLTRPMGWEKAVNKFSALSGPRLDSAAQKQIIDAIDHLEDLEAGDLPGLLENIQ